MQDDEIVINRIRTREWVPINHLLKISDQEDGLKIEVGNTDLRLQYNKSKQTFIADFTPENKWSIEEIERKDQQSWAYRQSSVFLYAMHHLIEEIKINHSKLVENIDTDFIIHHTNEYFANFLNELFSRFDHSDLITVEKKHDELSEYSAVSLNYRELLKLESEDKLIKFIKKVAKKNEGLVVWGLVDN